MKYPLISVIIPTFNRSHLLSRAIKSVLTQTYKNLEIIVVDDGSKDDTEKIVKDINDKRIKYIKHKENKGLSASRNTGILTSKGEFIAFLDDDDEYIPTKLEKQLKKFEHSPPETGVIYCGILHIYEGQELYKRVPKDKISYSNCLQPAPMGWQIVTGLIRKECFNEVGLFDESLFECEDWDILIRMSKYYNFDYIKDILYIRHIHGHQMITDLKRRIKGRKLIIDKHKAEFMNYPKFLSWQYRLLGSLYCMDNNFKEAKRYFIKSIKFWPFNLGSYIHILLLHISTSIHKKIIKHIAFKKAGNNLLYY